MYTHAITHVNTHVCTCMSTPAHVGINTHTHTHTHTHAHTHTEEAEDGEEVVGFGLRKLLKETVKDEKPESPPKPKKQFSLDFPPGLVHDESECVKSPQCWKAIKRILDEKGSQKKRKRLKMSC